MNYSLSACFRAGVFLLTASLGHGQLLTNLRSFGNSVSLIDPAPLPSVGGFENDGPKELVCADFDVDGKPDLAASKVSGKVSVVFGLGGKDFQPAQFLVPPENTGELRGIAFGDFNGDGRPDIATAAPYSGRVVIFFSGPGRSFAAPVVVNAWRGVRNLIAADLDGDGDQDILAAGPDGAASSWTTSEVRISAIYRNGANFTAAFPLTLPGSLSWEEEFPRPVCSLAVLPPLQGTTAQRVILTHAMSSVLWTTSWDSQLNATVVQPSGSTLVPTQSLAVGRVLTQDGLLDLITGARDDNQILVRRGLAAGGFDGLVAQRIYLPGAPRAIAIADVDNDGWNDVLVVLRQYDRVVTLRSDAGVLKLVAEAPTGSSPRDLAVADFNGDGRPDLAVANRKSDNLSVLLTQASSAGFERLDTVYPLDGGVSAMQLKDMNNDGRADVILSHIHTSEISVRISGPGGLLQPPVFTKLFAPPLATRMGDFNSDGKVDLITVHNATTQPGMSILMGRGDGSFASPVFLPSDDRMFSIFVSDFDGDGVADAAAGYYDCRLALYKGNTNGTFTLKRSGLFTYEARAMVTGDFDQDGDVDIAGASAMGTMTVVQNDGHLLEPPAPGTPHSGVFTRTETHGSDKSGIKSMVILDANGDTDPDVAINTEQGVFIYIGGPGLSFTAQAVPLPGTNSATDLVKADFDGDGIPDLATACRLLSCVAILKGQPDLSFQTVAVTPVPAADMIAAGDIDGDGKADLAGAGEVLWTALSGRAPQSAAGSAPSARPPMDSVVINEMMSSNLSIPLDTSGKTPDFVEIFNGKSTAVDMTGWKLRYQETPVPGVLPPPAFSYTFPGGSLPPGGRRVLICDEGNLADHTPYKLSKTGATLTLLDAANQQVDSLTWQNQAADVSTGRFSDGATTWITKTTPDPGQPNFWSGQSGPDFKQVTVEPATVRPNTMPRFYVKAEDEAGIFTLTAVWKWLNAPPGTPQFSVTGQTGLFDDGLHGDGGSLDGLYSATAPVAFPAGAKVEFFVKATNLLDQEEISPGDPIFSLAGQEVTNYAFTVPDTNGPVVPGLEISEVQTHSAILDEIGTPSDFVELRNTSAVPIPLTGFALRDGLYSNARTFALYGTLAAGQHLFFYADSDTSQGTRHMPFKLSNEGDSVWLVRLDSQGVPTIVDKVAPPSSESGTDSWARIGPGGPFAFLPPTPAAVNLSATRLHCELIQSSTPGGIRTFRLAMSVPVGSNRTMESWIPGGTWQAAGTLTGNGFESFLDFPIAPSSKSRFFRAR